jgi:hypothetical protein
MEARQDIAPTHGSRYRTFVESSLHSATPAIYILLNGMVNLLNFIVNLILSGNLASMVFRSQWNQAK